jgi:hypothetical protein
MWKEQGELISELTSSYDLFYNEQKALLSQEAGISNVFVWRD